MFIVYIYNDDFLFVSAAIHAIGRIASRVPEISDICLSGLLGLLSCTDLDIAGESVIVIQRLLHLGPGQNEDVIIRLSKMLDKTENSNARASIIWIIGEHCHRIPLIAPDVLRKAAKMFLYETDPVKHQTLNLAAKLVCLNSKQTRVLCQYVFSLGRFDQSYDIRDKSRLLRNILFPPGDNIIHKYSKKLIISHKPAPQLRSPYKDREQWQLGSLSHFLNIKVVGYKLLPDFPHKAPKSTVRDVFVESDNTFIQKPVGYIRTKDLNTFYSSHGESSSATDSESITDTDESYDSDISTHSSASSLSELSGHREFEESVPIHKNELHSETDNTSGSDTSDTSDSNQPIEPLSSNVNNPQSKCLLIDEFTEEDVNANILEPMCNDTLLTPTKNLIDELEPILPKFVTTNYNEVMNKYNGNGISIKYRMLRRRFNINTPRMIEVELLIENHEAGTIFSDLSIDPASGTNLQKGNEFGKIFPLSKVYYSVGIDFNDSIQPAKLFVRSLDANINNSIYIHPTCGELMLPVYFPEMSFLKYQKRFGGMSVTKGDICMNQCSNSIDHQILEGCNLNPIPTSNQHTKLYAGITASKKSLVLVSIIIQSDNLVSLEVDCDHMMISDSLFSIIKEILIS
ncbi:AP-3 complex subunit beta-2-like [Oopsacas minuta]|uniref:AP-3 complex subunit beta-2-like n=1 Tax=Oopsacas minuta TaxID=111878 RepID=A0AAV7K326_9METZ|nr:AP-3 complex subunit beta-2-like [Oopsacas minuta]